MKTLHFAGVFFVFCLCVILQTTVGNWISIYEIAPDFLLIFVAHRAFRRGPSVGAGWGFFVGFACDVYGPLDWLGIMTISVTLFGYLLGLLEERFLTLRPIPRLFAVGLGLILCDMVQFVLTGAPRENLWNHFLFRTLPCSAYTIVCAGIAFYFLFRKRGRAGNV